MPLKIYRGVVTYNRGTWANEDGRKYVVIDEDYANDQFEYEFEDVYAKSIEQLFYVLSCDIQDNINASYPIFISTANQKNITVSGSFPTESTRFNELASTIGRV